MQRRVHLWQFLGITLRYSTTQYLYTINSILALLCFADCCCCTDMDEQLNIAIEFDNRLLPLCCVPRAGSVHRVSQVLSVYMCTVNQLQQRPRRRSFSSPSPLRLPLRTIIIPTCIGCSFMWHSKVNHHYYRHSMNIRLLLCSVTCIHIKRMNANRRLWMIMMMMIASQSYKVQTQTRSINLSVANSSERERAKYKV